jgi:hypothetical protein
MRFDTVHFTSLNRLQHLSLARVVVHSHTLNRHLSLAGSALPTLRRLSLYDVDVVTGTPNGSDDREDMSDNTSSTYAIGNIDTLAVHMFSDRIRQYLCLFAPPSATTSSSSNPISPPTCIKRLTLSWCNPRSNARYRVEDLKEMVQYLGLRASLTHLSLRLTVPGPRGVNIPLLDDFFRMYTIPPFQEISCIVHPSFPPCPLSFYGAPVRVDVNDSVTNSNYVSARLLFRISLLINLLEPSLPAPTL